MNRGFGDWISSLIIGYYDCVSGEAICELVHVKSRSSSAGVPNLWYMYPLGCIGLSQGVYLLYSRNKLTLRHKNGVCLTTFIVVKI